MAASRTGSGGPAGGRGGREDRPPGVRVRAVRGLGEIAPVFVSEGGLEPSSRGFFPGVVKSPAACSSAAETGEMSPASVPERRLDPVFR